MTETNISTADDLLEGLTAAIRDSAAAAAGGIWREEPATLFEFVTSPEHLGLAPLYPLQAQVIEELFGQDPKLVFAEPLDLEEKLRRAHQIAVCVWGKGSGKDYICSIVICWLVHILLCLRDPQAYLQLAPGEPIDIVNVAYNAKQAKDVFFAKVVARMERWKWLKDHYRIVKAGRRVNEPPRARGLITINGDFIEFPGLIRAHSRHAQNESYEGLNVLAWVMDEASAFLSEAKRENADAIYQTLRTSAVSRFGSRWCGWVISYPRRADDFTMDMLRKARDRPNLGILADGPRATWEVNERTRNEPRHKVRDLEVPLSLANDFESDYEQALAMYCCEPPMARQAFFAYPEHLRAAVKEGRVPLVEWERCLISRTDGDGGEERSYVGVRLTQLRELPRGCRLYAHGDPGLVHDSFALAIAHAVPATVMRHLPASEVLPHLELSRRLAAGELEDPEGLIDWEVDVARTVVDALIVWRPDQRAGHQVDLQNVEDTIFELRQHYPSIGHWPSRTPGELERRPTLTFDHWNSALTIQRMRSKRMNVKDEAWTRDFQVGIYRNARTNFYNGLVTLPDTPSITSMDPADPGALYELERIEFVDAVKIDHPSDGGKDRADAIVRVIQHATEHNRGASIAYGSVERPTGDTSAWRPGSPARGPHAAPGGAGAAQRAAGGFVFGSLHGGVASQLVGIRQELPV